MTMHFGTDPFDVAKIVDFVLLEREKSLSPREWKHRLAGFGYGVKDTEAGQIVTTWPGGAELCILPQPAPQDA